ncbi:MAG: DnaB-like helicase C-terminal domain-containing protein [Gemmatimonadaceae bacterium]
MSLPLSSNRPSPSECAAQRTEDALERLRVDPRTFFRVPVPSIHRLCGAFAPQELIVIGARPGNGKSLLAHNLVRWYRQRNIPCYIMGTEQSPDVLSIKQACVDLQLPFRLVLKPEEEDIDSGRYDHAIQEVTAHLRRMSLDDMYIQWSNHEYMDRAALAEGCQWAVDEMGAQVLILDHLHHMQHGEGRDPVAELTATVHLAKHLAKRHKIVVIAFAQLRRRVDVSTYEPPDMEDFAGAAAIERTADIALGAWRPLRQDLTAEQIKELKAKAREQKTGTDTIYEPNTMGLRLLKDRLGSVFGKQALVRVNNGRIEELPERDHYSTRYGAKDGV